MMVGMTVVVTKCDESGNVDMADLKAKCEQHSANLAAVMITYPSTHGVFETSVKELCALVHPRWSGLCGRCQHERPGGHSGRPASLAAM
jgi:glycine cleavage system protein P-like pyridoxal-binding family